MTTLVERMSNYAAGLRFEDLPAEVVHQTKRLIIDTVGCALGGYDSEPARIARAIAGTVTSTERATVIGNVSMWKGCAFANASRNAVFAAMLAARGITGPSPVFEGVGGYFKAVTRKPFELTALGGKDHPYRIMKCLMKRFPLGQYSQTVAEAAIEARGKIKSIDEIADVHVETLATAITLMAGDPQKWEPETRETADHSMPYTVAAALMYGDIGDEQFQEACFRDPRLRALTRRVKVSEWEEANRRMPEAMLCRVTVTTHSGEKHAASVDCHRGHWKNPMTDGEVEAKFRKLALRVLPTDAANHLLEQLWKLEQLADAGEVLRLTVPE